MPRFQNNPFPGIDPAQYLSWEKVTTPDGQTLYIVPGNPGYVYDPVASNATGDTVFRKNPKQKIDAQAEADRQQQELIDQEKFNRSPMGQLLPVAGTTGGLILANQLMTPAASPIESAIAAQISGNATAAASGASAAAPTAITGAAPVVGTPVASAPITTLPGAEVAATEAAPGLFSGFAPMASSLGGAAALGGIAAGTYLGGQAGYDMLRGKKPGLPGRIVLGMATGGLSELAAPFLSHKSTRDRQKDVTNRFLDEAGDDANAQSYVQGMREQFNSAPPDPSKPYFGGKYSTFDEYQKAGLNAADLSGVEGNMDAYGVKEWANLSQAEREKATQALIEAGQYQAKDGGIKVRDKNEAKKIIDSALGFNASTNSQTLGHSAATGAITAKQRPGAR